MTTEEIIREFASLPPNARQEVEDFITFLRERYAKKNERQPTSDLLQESFVGMWKDREDMQDGAIFVREFRESEWGK